MKKGKWMFLLSLLVLLLPSAAWATTVPEVTAEEYRYFLECVAVDAVYLDLDEIAQYDDAALRAKVIAAVEEEVSYRDFMEYDLWDGFPTEYLTEQEMGKYSEKELEQMEAHAYAQMEYTYTKDALQKDYQIAVPADSTPQEIAVLYYRTLLQKEYGITEDLSDKPWYVLQQYYYQMSHIVSLEEELGEKQDTYVLAELEELEKALTMQLLQRDSGTTQDLSDYSLEELQQLQFELQERTTLEQEIRDYDYQGDLSDYTLDELYELESSLAYAVWEKEYEAEQATAKSKVSVQINGEELYVTAGQADAEAAAHTYTSDAAPIIRDGRTYIPFRAVFEALGADVSYNATDKTVTAKRGERTVSFAVGQNCYVSNGVTVQMDAQTFVQAGRTFVPVRFASQALGAAVGWDAENRTVVIFERDKFINRYKGQFTVLEQYIRHWDFAGAQNLALQGNFDLHLAVTDEDDNGKKTEVPMNLTIEFESLTSDTRINYDAAVKLELDQLIAALEKDLGPINGEMMQFVNKFKQFHVQYIMDAETGTLYLKSELLDLLQGKQNAWYCLEIKDYLDDETYQQYVAMMPDIMDQLEQHIKTMTMNDVVRIWVEAADVNDADDVSSTIELLDWLYRVCGDRNLGKTAQGYTHSVGSAEDGYIGKITFRTAQNEICGMQFSFDTVSGSEYASLDQEWLACHVQLKEENHVMTLTGTIRLDDYLNLQCNGVWNYTATDAVPVSKPQGNPPVYDLMELLEALGIGAESEQDEAA